GAIVLAVAVPPPALANHVPPANTQAVQERAIELGVSGSSQTFLRIKNAVYCYAGTLGALVQDSAGAYILSNNHVLAKENGKLTDGDVAANATIIQPGLLDEGPCALDSGDPTHAVADLSRFVEIQFGKGRNKPENVVDAAVAAVRPGKVDPSG